MASTGSSSKSRPARRVFPAQRLQYVVRVQQHVDQLLTDVDAEYWNALPRF